MEQCELNEMSIKHELLRRNVEIGVLVISKVEMTSALRSKAEDLVNSSLTRLSDKLNNL